MKKIFCILVIFYSFAYYAQDTRGTVPPPPAKYPKEKTNYNIDDNLVHFKIDKLSNSFDFNILDKNKIPLENIFLISFTVEENYNILNYKIEKGKNKKILTELNMLIYSAKLPPSFIEDKITSKLSYRLKFIFDYKKKKLDTVLL